MILFLAANPADTRPRALDEECAAIERELKLTAARDDFEFRSKWAVTVDELMRHLLDLQPAIIHFSGHGNARGLLLEGDDGRSQLVAPTALSKMIKSTAASARVAVLSACYSDAQAEALRDVVGCAIGMRGTISDDAARSFAVGFYRALGYRCSVGNAYEQAVATLAAKGLSDAEPRCLVRAGIDLDALKLDGAPSATRVQPVVPVAAQPARYDLFLAHAAADKPSARALHDLLLPDVQAFLDERSIPDGARWDVEIPAAQRASRATVVLLSTQADRGWYLSDEISAAIALHRAAPALHALVPVLLEPGAPVPYGLSQLQAIDAVAAGGLAGVAARLRQVVAHARRPPGAP
ncbi:MAG TPA: TIR domain-containing protein [Kofleriaceae bacterium]